MKNGSDPSVEHDEASLDLEKPEFPHACVRKASPESARKRAERRERRLARKARLHDEHRPGECGYKRDYLAKPRPLAQEEPREEDREERRRLVERHRLAYRDHGQRIEVAEYPDEARDGPPEQQEPRLDGKTGDGFRPRAVAAPASGQEYGPRND